MNYQMLVLDIDGTLTNSKKEITSATKQALLALQEKGIILVLASGRPTAGIRHVAEELELSRFHNYILSFNGAKIINCGTGETIYEKTIPTPLIPEIYQAALTYHAGLISYEGDEVIAATEIDEYMKLEAGINQIPIRRVPDFSSYITFPVNKCLMTGTPEHMKQVEKKLSEQFHGILNIYRSEPYFLELMPQNIDKAHSLSKLLSSLSLTQDQMVCCGDGFNDISMLEYAGLGVAMLNAHELVREKADYITSSNDEDGITQVIRCFFQ